MRNALALGLLVGMIAGCVPTAADLSAPAVPTNVVPDPDYHPKIGDRAVLFGTDRGTNMDNIPLLLDATALDKYERQRQSGTMYDIAELEERKDLQWTPAGTRVIVLALYDRTHIGSRLAAEIRLLDGPQKDHVLWTPLEHVTRFITKEVE